MKASEKIEMGDEILSDWHKTKVQRHHKTFKNNNKRSIKRSTKDSTDGPINGSSNVPINAFKDDNLFRNLMKYTEQKNEHKVNCNPIWKELLLLVSKFDETLRATVSHTPSFGLCIYGNLNYLSRCTAKDKLSAYRELKYVHKAMTRLYEVASSCNGTLISNGEDGKGRESTIASVLGDIRSDLKYKLGDKVALIGINDKKNSHIFNEQHMMLDYEIGDQHAAENVDFRVIIELFQFENNRDTSNMYYAFTNPPEDYRKSPEKNFLTMPLFHFLFGGSLLDLQTVVTILKCGKRIIVVKASQNKKAINSLADLICEVKDRLALNESHDGADAIGTESFFHTPFIRSEMPLVRELFKGRGLSDDNITLDAIRTVKKQLNCLIQHIKKILVLDVDKTDQLKDNVLENIRLLIEHQLENVIEMYSPSVYENEITESGRFLAGNLLVAMKFWKACHIDIIQKIEFDIKVLFVKPDYYKRVTSHLFRLALERHVTEEDRVFIIRTLLNKHFRNELKIENLASAETMLDLFRDATKEGDQLIYCQLYGQFNYLDEIIKPYDEDSNNNTCNSETAAENKRLLKTNPNDDKYKYFIHYLRKNINYMTYGKRKLVSVNNLDAIFIHGHSILPDEIGGNSGVDISQHWSRNAALQTLLFWCIVTDNQKLLDYLWSKSDNPVMTGLVISSVYRSLSKMKNTERDTVEEFKTECLEYEAKADKVFRIAHSKNWREAEDLLLHSQKEYQDFSILEIAGVSSSQQFLSHPGVWNKINELWKRKQSCKRMTASTIFCLDWISNLIFVLLFAWFYLTSLCNSIMPLEIILFIWVVALILEEFRQVYDSDLGIDNGRMLKSIAEHLRFYCHSGWNLIDLFSISCFLGGFILHLVVWWFHQYFFTEEQLKNGNCPLHLSTGMKFVQACYGFSFLGFVIQVLHYLVVFEKVGEKVLVLKKLWWDIVVFGCLFVTFAMSYGVIIQSILYPNEWRADHLLDGALFKSYFHVFGELFLGEVSQDPYQDRISQDDGSCYLFINRTHYELLNTPGTEEKMPRCPYSNRVAVGLVFVYMMFGNVVLLNMLIAMMSNTYNNVSEINSVDHNQWFTNKYMIIKQYLERPGWVPPFNILYIIYRFWKQSRRQQNQFRKKVDHETMESGRQLIKSATYVVNEQSEHRQNKIRRKKENEQKETIATLRKLAWARVEVAKTVERHKMTIPEIRLSSFGDMVKQSARQMSLRRRCSIADKYGKVDHTKSTTESPQIRPYKDDYELRRSIYSMISEDDFSSAHDTCFTRALDITDGSKRNATPDSRLNSTPDMLESRKDRTDFQSESTDDEDMNLPLDNDNQVSGICPSTSETSDPPPASSRLPSQAAESDQPPPPLVNFAPPPAPPAPPFSLPKRAKLIY